MTNFLRLEIHRWQALLQGFATDEMRPSSRSEAMARIRSTFFAATGMTLKQQRQFTVAIFVLLGFSFLLSFCAGVHSGCLSLFVGIVGARYCMHRMVRKRSRAFEGQYPAFLISLASSIRAGREPLAAICASTNVFPADSVMHEELQKLNQALERGQSEDDAIRHFAGSVTHPDIALFRMAIILARRQGASLGDTLHRLTRVTRLRQSFRRRVKAALAMQRLSAIGISICAILIGLLQAATNPTAILTAWHTSLGKLFLLLGSGLVVVGLLWMLHLARERE